MTAETLQEIINLTIDMAGFNYWTLVFVGVGIYVIVIALKIQRAEDDSK